MIALDESRFDQSGLALSLKTITVAADREHLAMMKQAIQDSGGNDGITKDLATPDYAAEECADYSKTVSGTEYSNWFLPSKDELDLMYDNLYVSGFGGFSSAFYWSSYEYDGDYSYIQYFTSGEYGGVQEKGRRDGTRKVRPARAF